jgi:hypothetical protein
MPVSHCCVVGDYLLGEEIPLGVTTMEVVPGGKGSVVHH